MGGAMTGSLELLIEAEECRRLFRRFAQKAWHVIEPGKKYVQGWHLDAIAEHLQAVIGGDIKRLLLNMPPRHGKSSFISTLIPPLSRLQNPRLRPTHPNQGFATNPTGAIGMRKNCSWRWRGG